MFKSFAGFSFKSRALQIFTTFALGGGGGDSCLNILSWPTPFFKQLHPPLKVSQFVSSLSLLILEVHENESQHHNYNGNNKRLIIANIRCVSVFLHHTFSLIYFFPLS
jgi:hypothetical protein